MSLSQQLKSRIDEMVESDEVVLFMKGNRTFPQCGFSATVVQILNNLVPNYTTVNVLADPEIRQGIKVYSDWPTIPQLYVRGEFVGGCDIVRSMFESGELQSLVGAPDVSEPKIQLTDAAAAALKEALGDAGDGDVIHLGVSPAFEHGLDIGPKNPDAFAIEVGGLTINVDKMSAARADGISIDFQDGPGGTGFKIENPNAPPAVEQISPEELKAKLDAGEIKHLYDVRTPQERETARIEGARLLDDDAVAEIESLPKDTPIAFHCHHGGRSQAAADHFRDKGYKVLYNLAGGIDAWSQTVDPSVPRY